MAEPVVEKTADQPAAPDAGKSLLSQEPAPKAESPEVKTEVAPENKPETETVPESYEFKLPDGITLDEKLNSEFVAQAKELGLTQSQAQKLMDLGVANLTQQEQAQAAKWHEQCDKWQEEIRADKEFGGERLTETVERARRTLDKFGSPELMEFLDQTRMGDCPDLLRLLAKVDKALGEDVSVEGSAASNEKSLGKRLYPNM